MLTGACGCVAQVKAFVELVGSLLSASGPGSTGRAGAATLGLSTEMVRAMREAGIVKALTTSLKLIDMDHPKVRAESVCLLHEGLHRRHSWSSFLCHARRRPRASTQC